MIGEFVNNHTYAEFRNNYTRIIKDAIFQGDDVFSFDDINLDITNARVLSVKSINKRNWI